MPGGQNFNEAHDIEFRQIVLLVTNVLWLGLEWCYFDTTKTTQFSLIRATYFFFVGVVRAEGTIQKDNTDLDVEDRLVTKEAWKTFKVWCTDFVSWYFVVWMFGRSIM